MSKWDYLREIGAASDDNGDKLLDLMEKTGKIGLMDVTESEARNYWEEMKGVDHSCDIGTRY